MAAALGRSEKGHPDHRPRVARWVRAGERSVAHGRAACGNASGQIRKSKTVVAAIAAARVGAAAAGWAAYDVVTLASVRTGDVVTKASSDTVEVGIRTNPKAKPIQAVRTDHEPIFTI